MKKQTTLILSVILGILILIGLVFGILYATGVFQTAIGIPSNVKLAVPHNGAYFCTSVGTGNPSYTIPSNGLWITKNSIGVYTDQVTSLNVYISQTFWDSYFKSYLGGGIRAVIRICDSNQANCQADIYQSLTYSGTTTLNMPKTSFNPQQESVFITIQSRSTFLSAWKDDSTLNSKTKVNFAYTKYGLKYVSTTGNPAGALFNGCESSCDLTCPEQKSREDTGLIYTSKNSLLPTESVSVLEYWEDLDIDLNAEMGATIYDGTQFCFGGAIYSKAYITLDNGDMYIYPKTASRKNVECCTGAAISTSTEDKTCVNNKWVTITKDTRIKCTSDFNCPKQGQSTCNNLIKSGYHCGSDNYCSKDAINTPVECCSQADCPTDQTCQNYECVGGGNFPICGNGKVESGEQCDLGTLNGKIGSLCSTICTNIIFNQTIECKWYETKITTSTKDYGTLYWRFFTNNPIISTTDHCETSNFIYLIIALAVILFFVMIFVIIYLVARKK